MLVTDGKMIIAIDLESEDFAFGDIELRKVLRGKLVEWDITPLGRMTVFGRDDVLVDLEFLVELEKVGRKRFSFMFRLGILEDVARNGRSLAVVRNFPTTSTILVFRPEDAMHVVSRFYAKEALSNRRIKY